MLTHKLPQTPYIAFPLDWQVWVQENTVYSAFSIFISWWAMDLVGKPNTTSFPGIISIHVTHPRLHKCLQVHVIANAWLVRCVLVRLSPNWPNTNETEVHGRCWRCNIRRDSYSTESACRRGVNAPACLVAEQWRVSKTVLNTGWVCLQVIWTLCQYVINRTRQFTLRDLSWCITHLV